MCLILQCQASNNENVCLTVKHKVEFLCDCVNEFSCVSSASVLKTSAITLKITDGQSVTFY